MKYEKTPNKLKTTVSKESTKKEKCKENQASLEKLNVLKEYQVTGF